MMREVPVIILSKLLNVFPYLREIGGNKPISQQYSTDYKVNVVVPHLCSPSFIIPQAFCINFNA
jgi:hypothetical protein